jgi:hypothetical protein
VYVLTAAQGYQAALEVKELGHGLLRFALVEEGLKSSVADKTPEDGKILAREWLDYATMRVPESQEAQIDAAQKKDVPFPLWMRIVAHAVEGIQACSVPELSTGESLGRIPLWSPSHRKECADDPEIPYSHLQRILEFSEKQFVKTLKGFRLNSI